ncbi:MAG: sigma-70 family RNA polymerase sigma factor [Chitinivibrionales bacterium]|nr:sigma-70 family RNA polymerase sigma factor [Chitinivibrionales bacterium]MBD3357374.1 sigma-70 family RNA polymerase sigma factor [Chitinivibrionales bacterium]
MMKEIDELTIKAAAKDQKGAFKRIYDHYAPFVWNVVYRTVRGDTDAAKEIMQDTFVKLHGSLNAFRFNAAFSTWLYRIAWNATMTHMAKRRRERERYVPLDPETPGPGRSGGFEAREAVSGILKKLTPEERFLLVSREVQGVSFEELAKITGRKEGALRTRLHRIRGAVRKEVDYE